MTDIQQQFHEIQANDGKIRRIAYRRMPGRDPSLPGLFWLAGFHSDMASTKATALQRFAEARGQAFTGFDYSGDGQSSGKQEDGTISHWLAEAEAIFSTYTEGPQILVGSSMGAWIALLMTRLPQLRNAGRIAALVLIAPAWDMTEELMWKRFPASIRQAILDNGIYHLPSNYASSGYPITKALIEDGRSHLIGGAPFPVPAPVRIIHGMRDMDVPFEHSLKLAELLQGSSIQLTLVKDGEHRLSRENDLILLFRTLEQFRV